VSPAVESTPLEMLISNILETRFDNFDRKTVRHAKDRIIDTIGCAIGGANDPGNSELEDLIKDYGGKQEATILVRGGKVPACNAAMVNSILARSFDFEPVGPMVDNINTPGHNSGTTVMAAVAVGELKNVNGKELITALLVGDDVTSRLLAASGFGFTAGWDGTGTVNAFGTAAIAGRLLGLDKLQLRNAFGIVLNQLGGSFQCIWDGTTSFKLPQGLSARNGVFSAQLAEKGWLGPEDALLSEFGYYKLYTEGCKRPELLTKNLGKEYYSDGTIKPYPCCRFTHGAIDCALALVNNHGIRAEDIRELTLYVSTAGYNHICSRPFRIGGFPHVNAAFSFRYTVATALLKNSVRPEHFTENSIRDAQINALVTRIKIAEWPEAELLNTRMTAVMQDGKEVTEVVKDAKGDMFYNPMSAEEIRDKFWMNVHFSRTVSEKKAAKLLTLLENLEEVEIMKEMMPLLVA
jgi:2-methylcitrate dehydratase PrpD